MLKLAHSHTGARTHSDLCGGDNHEIKELLSDNPAASDPAPYSKCGDSLCVQVSSSLFV